MMSTVARTGPRIVCVGGVAGGSTAATKARRENENAQITIIERGPFVSFSNCGLPYYISGKVDSRDKLFVTTPQKLFARYGLDVRVDSEVVKIDRGNRTVDVKKPDGTVEALPWDKLILAQGAGAIIPENLPGVHASNVLPLKTVPDLDEIMGIVNRLLPKSAGGPNGAPARPPNAVIVGAGYIGLEVADNLVAIGMKVTCVDLLPQVVPTMDADMAQWVERQLLAKGVDLVLGEAVKGFVTTQETRENGKKVEVAREVQLGNGKSIPADLIILSIGVKPDTALARAAGLEIGETGGVKTNEYCQSVTDPDIYATGDMAEIKHLVTGKPARIALAGPANKMGRVAGANAAAPQPYLKFKGAMGSSVIGVMGITAAATGLTERQAKQAGYDYAVAIAHANNHTAVYPGAKQIHMKVVFEKSSGRVLGAQAVGEAGVDKRVDVIATAIYAKLTIHDLEDLDLVYAPEFSSAKDPVNVLGWVADNVNSGYVKAATYPEMVEQLSKLPPGSAQFVDVRDLNEVARDGVPAVPVPDAKWLHIPVDTLRMNLGKLDKSKKTYLLCHSGLRSYLGCRILQQHGFDALNIQGGMMQVPMASRVKL